MKCDFTEDGCLRVIAESGAEWMAFNAWDKKYIEIVSPSEYRKETNRKFNELLEEE